MSEASDIFHFAISMDNLFITVSYNYSNRKLSEQANPLEVQTLLLIEVYWYLIFDRSGITWKFECKCREEEYQDFSVRGQL